MCKLRIFYYDVSECIHFTLPYLTLPYIGSAVLLYLGSEYSHQVLKPNNVSCAFQAETHGHCRRVAGA